MTYRKMELPDGMESLSHSRRKDYAVCPRLFFYKYELGLKPIDTPPPLRMGAIIGKAIEDRDAEVAHAEYARMIAEAMDEQRHDLVNMLLDEQAVVTAAARVKLARPEVTADMVPEVEFVGEDVNGFCDNGRFDEIVTDYNDGGILIVERKFKTYFSGSWADELLMDDQITSYVRAAMLKYDVPLEKVHVQFEVLWKPRVRKTKADVTPEVFRKRKADVLVTKEADHHTILLPGTDVLERNAQQLQDWWDRFERMTEDLLRERELAAGGGVEAWPQHPHSCFRFNRHCEFIKLCTAATQDQFAGEMKAEFTTREQRAERKRLLDELADAED